MLCWWCSTNGFTADLLTDGWTTPIVGWSAVTRVDARQPGDFKGRSPLPSRSLRRAREPVPMRMRMRRGLQPVGERVQQPRHSLTHLHNEARPYVEGSSEPVKRYASACNAGSNRSASARSSHATRWRTCTSRRGLTSKAPPSRRTGTRARAPRAPIGWRARAAATPLHSLARLHFEAQPYVEGSAEPENRYACACAEGSNRSATACSSNLLVGAPAN